MVAPMCLIRRRRIGRQNFSDGGTVTIMPYLTDAFKCSVSPPHKRPPACAGAARRGPQYPLTVK